MSGKKIYKTMRGKTIDLHSIMKRNGTTPAVGNANLNAQGDLINKQGSVLKTREQLANEKHNPTKR